MTNLAEPDSRGVDALTGGTGDGVPLAPRIWEEMVAELGPLPPVPVTEPFDEQPWSLLPTLEQLQELWLASPLVDIMIHRLAVKIHGDGADLPMFMAQQREQAELELAWMREAEYARAETVHHSGFGQDGAVAAAAAGRGGADFPGGPEDSVTVGEGGQADQCQDAGRPSQVSGKQRKRRAGKG